MKRAELKVGEEYAVAAPSVNLNGRYASVKRVRVLDVEPTWVKRTSSFSFRDDSPRVNEVDFEGEVVQVRDHTQHVDGASYRWDDAKKVVKVFVGGWEGVGVVPLSQIRETWAEYDKRHQAIIAADNRARREREKERAEARAEQDAIRDTEQALGIEPARFDAYQTQEVGLTRAQYVALLTTLTEYALIREGAL